MAGRQTKRVLGIVAYGEATRIGANALGAVRVGKSYYYRAEETGKVYRLTRLEVASYGAGQMDERGMEYSLWCSATGSTVKRLSNQVREALKKGLDL